MIIIKSGPDLQIMRTAGAILAGIMARVQAKIKDGIETKQLDRFAHEAMAAQNVESAFFGYRGYPGYICVSVNEQVVHGIPGSRIVREGDIVSLDMGIKYQGFFSDAAMTVAVGTVSPEAKQLIEITKKSLSEGIKHMQAGRRLSDISHAVQQYVEQHGFSVVRQFVGHGIGRSLHEDPEIPNFGKSGQGPVMQNGMVFAIEPMVNEGTWECEILDDGWTTVTADRKMSAHWEHTVALTENGPEILTRY
jgi:methionyl aminopeptidase